IGPKSLWNFTHTDNLRRDLLHNYDKFARPTQHNNITTVKIGLTIRHVEINEFKSTMTVNCYLRVEWTDEKLKWNESNYGGLNQLHLAEHELWQPDVSLYNSASGTGLNHYGTTHCMVYPNGVVLWVPPALFTVLCSLNMKYWPFDTQECRLMFGSWTYHGDQIDLQLYSSGEEVELDLLVKSSEWTLMKAVQLRDVKYYPCCEEPYPYVEVNITLSRISPSYKAIIVTPTFGNTHYCGNDFVEFLVTAAIWRKKWLLMDVLFLQYACTCCISHKKIPAMGDHTPLIVLFYSSCLYITSFSMIGSIIVIAISRNKHMYSLPWIIKQPLIGRMGKLLGLHGYIHQATTSPHRVTAEEMRDHQVTDFDDNNSGDEHHMIKSSLNMNKPSFQHEWILLAAAIDRISFVFYCLLFAILAIVYSV
ncbi:hypothetical protein NQ318_022227, partial [Aromia moschata]